MGGPGAGSQLQGLPGPVHGPCSLAEGMRQAWALAWMGLAAEVAAGSHPHFVAWPGSWVEQREQGQLGG